jgi:phytoene dehydrogenase-like protein
MDAFDVIVVGGGLGGLTAGAKLAREGYRVLLLEQHAIIGGCATVFRRKDFLVEVSLHGMDGMDKDDPKARMLNDLGVTKQLDLVRVPEFYRFVNPRVDIAVPDNTKDAVRTLEQAFPREKQGIRTFFKTINTIRQEVARLPDERWKINLSLPLMPFFSPHLVFNMHNNLGRFLDRIIQDEDLKLLLQANLIYYHDDPYSMSMIYFGTAQGSYFTGGAYFIKGGSQKLSDCLAGIIKEKGGMVKCNQLVTSLLTRGRKVIGVAYRNSKGKKTVTKTAFASAIIANCAIPNVADLLPKEQGRVLKKKIKNKKPACSLFSVYLGFKKNLGCLGNKSYSTFVFDSHVATQRQLLQNHHDDYTRRNFVFVDYGRLDSGLVSEGKSLGVINVVDYLADWALLDSKAYARKKKEVTRILIQRLEALLPGSSDLITYCEAATPKTIQRFTLNPEGTAYGFAQTPNQAGLRRLSEKSGIPNLYFASAWIYPGGGYSGAIWGGWLCAKEVMKKLGKR